MKPSALRNRNALLYHARALRDAREETFANNTSTAAFIAIEAAGAFLHGKPRATLGATCCCLLALLVEVNASTGGPRTLDHPTLLRTVRHARNDRMHQGAAGRRSARLACELATRIEGALMVKANAINALTARDVMMSPVVTAECWQTLYELRRTMLAEGYSALPWRDGVNWRLVTADWLAKRLMEDEDHVQLKTELRCVPKDDLPPTEKKRLPGHQVGLHPLEDQLGLREQYPRRHHHAGRPLAHRRLAMKLYSTRNSRYGLPEARVR